MHAGARPAIDGPPDLAGIRKIRRKADKLPPRDSAFESAAWSARDSAPIASDVDPAIVRAELRWVSMGYPESRARELVALETRSGIETGPQREHSAMYSLFGQVVARTEWRLAPSSAQGNSNRPEPPARLATKSYAAEIDPLQMRPYVFNEVQLFTRVGVQPEDLNPLAQPMDLFLGSLRCVTGAVVQHQDDLLARVARVLGERVQ